MSTATTWDNDPFAVRPSIKAVSFEDLPIGTVKSGVVQEIETDVQGLDYTTKQLATWPSGDPKLSVVITLETDEGERALWVTKYRKDSKFQAIATAQQEMGRVLQKGDTLHLKLTAIEQGTKRKSYVAKIEPGLPGAAADPFAAPAGQATDVPF